ncbi:DUF4349 domain-containing protein [Gemmatirosa kalamazoonensis]|nr:DUF4349 domain-containing protein [Gemmatirosa kalamazoonensis]
MRTSTLTPCLRRVAAGALPFVALACGTADRGPSAAGDAATPAATVAADAAPKTVVAERRRAMPSLAAPPIEAPFAAAGAAAPPPADADAESPATLPSAAAASELATTMVVRTGTASIEVDSVRIAMSRLRTIASQVGGVVANASLAAGRAQVRSATLELKVPAGRFDELVNALGPIGRVEAVNVTAADVGEEYVDVAAREANARRLEARLVALLAERTGKLTDVLAVERELARVREEIERYDGRMRWLRAHSATSTLAINVHERPPILGPSPTPHPLAEALREAWRNFVILLARTIAASGVLLPLGALAYAAWRVATRGRGSAAGGQEA